MLGIDREFTNQEKLQIEFATESKDLTDSEIDLLRGTLNGLKLARTLYHKSKGDTKQKRINVNSEGGII